MGDTPTSDPQLMAEIAYHFWKDKWTSQGSNYSMIRQVLSTFNRTYSAKLVEIDIDMVCEVIDPTTQRTLRSALMVSPLRYIANLRT